MSAHYEADGGSLSRCLLIAVLLLLWAGGARADDDDCGAPKRLRGIDVSSWQGAIDWKRVKAAGVVFAFARVSDGLDVVDERFAENARKMKAAGVRYGAYQYFRASADAKQQADLLVSALRKARRFDLPPVLDIETADGQPREKVRAALKRWLKRVENRTGRRPLIYASPSMSELLDGRFGAWSLWVAHYEVDCPTLPDGWKRWTFWQHSSKGRVAGIAGDVDLDFFAGTLAALKRLAR
jgi:lysozyme